MENGTPFDMEDGEGKSYEDAPLRQSAASMATTEVLTPTTMPPFTSFEPLPKLSPRSTSARPARPLPPLPTPVRPTSSAATLNSLTDQAILPSPTFPPTISECHAQIRDLSAAQQESMSLVLHYARMASEMEDALATGRNGARRELEQSALERGGLLADRDSAQREVYRLRVEIKRIREERDAVVAERQAAQQENSRLEAEVDKARAERDSIVSSLTTQLRRSKTEVQEAVAGKEREVKRLVGLAEALKGDKMDLLEELEMWKQREASLRRVLEGFERSGRGGALQSFR
ncbi:hypothetical protein HDV00_002308 [Rhizophlyctis rosea]|nr:hypothetical protein HDV00_002308 [Rhizophlyctis rosea]